MPFQMKNDPKARKAGRFIYSVQKELQNALIASGLKQQEVAEKLDVNRSVVNKLLLGETNLTLRTIADLAWAMDAEVVLSIKPRHREQPGTGIDMPKVAPGVDERVKLSAAPSDTEPTDAD